MNVSKLIALCGGASEVAKKLGISTQAVFMWSHKNSIPLQRIARLRECFGGVFTKEVVQELAK